MANIRLKKDLEVVRKEVSRDVIRSIATQLGLKCSVSLDFIQYSLANVMLFDRKHQQYGADNIKAFGVHGVIIKSCDKYERIKHLFSLRQSQSRSEALEDSFRDLHNYGNIALMVENSNWPVV